MLLFIAPDLCLTFIRSFVFLHLHPRGRVRVCVCLCVRDEMLFTRVYCSSAAIALHYSQFAVDLPLSAPFLLD